MADLFKLLEGHKGSVVGWNEWKGHVTEVFNGGYRETCVFGCRLLSTRPAGPGKPDSQLRVYDFSMQGRVEYLSGGPSGGFGVTTRMSTTEARGTSHVTGVRHV